MLTTKAKRKKCDVCRTRHRRSGKYCKDACKQVAYRRRLMERAHIGDKYAPIEQQAAAGGKR
jgi:hypothetical protein